MEQAGEIPLVEYSGTEIPKPVRRSRRPAKGVCASCPGKAAHRRAIDLVGTIGLGGKENHSKDVLGRVYEYFLSQFASAEGKKSGQFYTPRCAVRLLVAMLASYKGRVFDPCCGSGGMFVQSEKLVEEHVGNRAALPRQIGEGGQRSGLAAKFSGCLRLGKSLLAANALKPTIANALKPATLVMLVTVKKKTSNHAGSRVLFRYRLEMRLATMWQQKDKVPSSLPVPFPHVSTDR
jgi:hypothetical protein